MLSRGVKWEMGDAVPIRKQIFFIMVLYVCVYFGYGL